MHRFGEIYSFSV